MKQKHTYIYFTSIYCIALLFLTNLNAQEEKISEKTSIDSTFKSPVKYGLRIGFDIIKIARPFLDKNYTEGFEINTDFRIKKNLYIAAEAGSEDKITATDILDTKTEGTFFKAGIDINLYDNWPGTDNLIYTGFRVGFSNFTQTINSFTTFNTNQTFSPNTINEITTFENLNATWAELIFGIKTEVLNNLYMTFNIQFKRVISESQPNNFNNLYIPGYNRTYDNGVFGFGFGYNISYVIPFYKKD